MGTSYVFAGLVVRDRDKAAGWYARLIGRPADMLPNQAEATWQLAGSASLYLLADKNRAGRGVAAIVVDDLDAELARIARNGIDPGSMEEHPGTGRKCVITDPDGNEVSLIELSATDSG
ncbi:MAG TPA: VOC family protein [Streptosporangiaceae bacterium]|nr:VOC family protein [Streptosporangiaceae bacterium]